MNKPARSMRSDGEATRARIMEAAGELFASLGFAETTGKAIAAHAHVDLASINYHFGSRSGLYQAVLIEGHRRLVDHAGLRRLAEGSLPATEKLRLLIEALVDRYMQASGWHVRVLARELLSPSSHMQVMAQDELLPKLRSVLRILGEITAIPEGDPALLRCLVSVVAPCAMLVVIGGGITGQAQEVLKMPRAALTSHLTLFALAGLNAAGRAYADSVARAQAPVA